MTGLRSLDLSTGFRGHARRRPPQSGHGGVHGVAVLVEEELVDEIRVEVERVQVFTARTKATRHTRSGNKHDMRPRKHTVKRQPQTPRGTSVEHVAGVVVEVARSQVVRREEAQREFVEDGGAPGGHIREMTLRV